MKHLLNAAIAFGVIVAIGMMANEDIGLSNIVGFGLFFACITILKRSKP